MARFIWLINYNTYFYCLKIPLSVSIHECITEITTNISRQIFNDFEFWGNLREIIYGHEHPDFIGAWLHWTKRYGPIFTVHFSSEPVVIITDFDLINGLIVKDAETFQGRWFFEPLLKQMKGFTY